MLHNQEELYKMIFFIPLDTKDFSSYCWKNFRFPGIIIITVICSGFDCISGTPNSFQVVEPINNL